MHLSASPLAVASLLAFSTLCYADSSTVPANETKYSVDDRNTSISYYLEAWWETARDQPASLGLYGNSQTSSVMPPNPSQYTSTPFFLYTFTEGISIEYWAATGPTQGPCTVVLDNEKFGNVTGHATTVGPPKALFVRGELDPTKSHTITVTTAAGDSKPNVCSLDRLVIGVPGKSGSSGGSGAGSGSGTGGGGTTTHHTGLSQLVKILIGVGVAVVFIGFIAFKLIRSYLAKYAAVRAATAERTRLEKRREDAASYKFASPVSTPSVDISPSVPYVGMWSETRRPPPTNFNSEGPFEQYRPRPRPTEGMLHPQSRPYPQPQPNFGPSQVFPLMQMPQPHAQMPTQSTLNPFQHAPNLAVGQPGYAPPMSPPPNYPPSQYPQSIHATTWSAPPTTLLAPALPHVIEQPRSEMQRGEDESSTSTPYKAVYIPAESPPPHPKVGEASSSSSPPSNATNQPRVGTNSGDTGSVEPESHLPGGGVDDISQDPPPTYTPESGINRD